MVPSVGYLQQRRRLLAGGILLTYRLRSGGWGPLLDRTNRRRLNPDLWLFHSPGASQENTGYIAPSDAVAGRLGFARPRPRGGATP